MNLTDAAKTRGAFLGIVLVGAAFVTALWGSRKLTYPDKITGKFTITTRVRAVEVVAPREGNISEVLVRNGQLVHAGELLARLVTAAEPAAVLRLEADLRDHTAATLPPLPPRNGLGELTGRYDALRNEQARLRRFRATSSQTTRQLDRNAQERRTLIEERIALLEAQKETTRDRIRGAEIARDDARALYQSNQIPYDEFLAKRDAVKSIETDLVRLDEQLTARRDALSQLDGNVIAQAGVGAQNAVQAAADFSIALTTLRDALRTWHQRHEIRAPERGTVSFPEGESPAGMVASPVRPLLTLLPPDLNTDTGLIAYLRLAADSTTTLREGMPVRLKFREYNFHEFGYVEGRIARIPPLKQDATDQFTLTVDLPYGLRTSRDAAPLPFVDGMAGTGEVFTKEISFWEMVF